MKSAKTKIELEGDIATVRMQITHPMESGRRKDPDSDQVIPAHYIKELTCRKNDELVLTAQWGPAVSKNPYLRFMLKGAKRGDQLTIVWLDNKGDSDTIHLTI